jgi:dihydroflavonol-4-reductase
MALLIYKGRGAHTATAGSLSPRPAHARARHLARATKQSAFVALFSERIAPARLLLASADSEAILPNMNDSAGDLVVVTGASGHIGANLVRELLARGRRVRALVHRDARALSGLAVEQAEGDVLDTASLDQAFRGAHTVFHLAAVISISGDAGGRVQSVNVTGARNAAAAARHAGATRYVHCSSIHAFDLYRASGTIDETSPRSMRPGAFSYDASKCQGEIAVRREIEQGLAAVIVNPTAVMGPFDWGPSRLGRVLLDLIHRRLPSLVDGGFDFVDVRDVVASMIAAEATGRVGENYLLGGHHHTVAELGAMATAVTGVPCPAITVPRWLAKTGVPFALAWGRLLGQEPLFTFESLDTLGLVRTIDTSKARAELGHAPRPLGDTVRDAYRWFVEAGVLPNDALKGPGA